jgi:hypothetical protein
MPKRGRGEHITQMFGSVQIEANGTVYHFRSVNDWVIYTMEETTGRYSILINSDIVTCKDKE